MYNSSEYNSFNMLIKGLAFKAVPQSLILLKKHSVANVLGLFLQITVSLSSIDDLLAATQLFIYLNKGDGYNWPSPPNEMAFVPPSCAQNISLLSETRLFAAVISFLFSVVLSKVEEDKWIPLQ